MDENHKNEQYFFDDESLELLADLLLNWERPCCICCPMLGKKLGERSVDVTVLDIDERFSDLRGYRRYDLLKPEWITERFDIIVCDPPFYNVSLTQLAFALSLLSHHDYSQPLLVSYLKRMGKAVLRSFSKFNLEPTGIFPK